MQCRLCGKEISEKFYRHLNSSHKTTKVKYLEMFPEDADLYLDQVPEVWNKGQTAETNSSIAKCAVAMKKYSNQSEIRKKRSEAMKNRYKNGDILDEETRRRVILAGNYGWQRKLEQSSHEERRLLLQKFTTAGNLAQDNRRHLLTPDDYQKRCVAAKGVARYHNCDNCGERFIAWFGGKPRPKKRFCNDNCWKMFREKHPKYCLPKGVISYFSSKMNLEFNLRSKLEFWIAEWLDVNPLVSSWYTPKYITYEYLGRKRRYYPDFLINENRLVEVKSDYVLRLQGEDLVRCKINAAMDYCKQNGLEFYYLQFNGPNLKRREVIEDERLSRIIGY